MVIHIRLAFLGEHQLSCFLRDFAHFAKTEKLRAEIVGPTTVMTVGLAASPEAFASWVVPLATEHGVVFS